MLSDIMLGQTSSQAATAAVPTCLKMTVPRLSGGVEGDGGVGGDVNRSI
jgi:hypothetical protein